MKLSEIETIICVLDKHLRLSWLPLLIKCQIKKEKTFRQTNWAMETSIESIFAKRLSLSTAIFLELSKRFDKDKAFEIMREIEKLL